MTREATVPEGICAEGTAEGDEALGAVMLIMSV